MKKYFELLRVKQYIKNLLMFIPYIFSGLILKEDKNVLEAVIAFAALCCICSCVYIINDILDCEKDKLHSTKKFRPIASGAVKKKKALIIVVFLFIASCIGTVYISVRLFAVIMIYFVINILYSIKLKQIPIIDLLCLSFFYVIRIYYGGVAFGTNISGWLYLTILSASFYLGIGKRYKELQNNGKNNTRDVMKYYDNNYLSSISSAFLSTTTVFYSLWIINGQFDIQMNNDILKISIAEMIVILLKYHLDVYSNQYDENPVEVFFADKTIITGTVVFGLTLLLSLFV